jgi:hypothetical protein
LEKYCNTWDRPFSITQIHDLERTVAVVERFQFQFPRCIETRWYRRQEAENALREIPARFDRHWLWFAISEIQQATKKNYFTWQSKWSALD